MAVVVADVQAETIKAGQVAGERSANARMLIVGLAAAAFVISLAVAGAIRHLLLKQLGGEPAYAAEIAHRIAEGDLAVHVEVAQHDQDSLLLAIKTMRDKLSSIVTKV
eukprot:gene21011-25748_t